MSEKAYTFQAYAIYLNCFRYRCFRCDQLPPGNLLYLLHKTLYCAQCLKRRTTVVKMDNEPGNKYVQQHSLSAGLLHVLVFPCISSIGQPPLTNFVNVKTALFRATIFCGCQRLAKPGLVRRVTRFGCKGSPTTSGEPNPIPCVLVATTGSAEGEGVK